MLSKASLKKLNRPLIFGWERSFHTNVDGLLLRMLIFFADTQREISIFQVLMSVVDIGYPGGTQPIIWQFFLKIACAPLDPLQMSTEV